MFSGRIVIGPCDSGATRVDSLAKRASRRTSGKQQVARHAVTATPALPGTSALNLFDEGISMNLHRSSLVAAAVAAALLPSRIMAADAVLVADNAVSADTAVVTDAAVATDAAVDSSSDSSLQEVIVTGTRQSGIKATDSPAPVQVVDAQQLAKTSATPDLAQTLAAVVPALEVAN